MIDIAVVFLVIYLRHMIYKICLQNELYTKLKRAPEYFAPCKIRPDVGKWVSLYYELYIR